jgi:hypothetical protein
VVVQVQEERRAGGFRSREEYGQSRCIHQTKHRGHSFHGPTTSQVGTVLGCSSISGLGRWRKLAIYMKEKSYLACITLLLALFSGACHWIPFDVYLHCFVIYGNIGFWWSGPWVAQ